MAGKSKRRLYIELFILAGCMLAITCGWYYSVYLDLWFLLLLPILAPYNFLMLLMVANKADAIDKFAKQSMTGGRL